MINTLTSKAIANEPSIINKYLMYLMSRSKDAAVCEDCDLEWRKI